jgi:glycosyltransferase involved in cell wall biosynthesis/SAM-dependent methyltransferase
VSLIDTGAQPRQVEDPEIEALLGTDAAADFQLFHGTPLNWARLAYPQRNVIAMTVWETDTMPEQWRNPLTHAIDVWLPCAFNIEVFNRGLRRTTFRLPHPAPLPRPTSDGDEFGLAADDFVFYSIFEWQDRKNPNGMIEAFLRAFPRENDAVLLLKSSSAAAAVAASTLAQLRAVTRSRGRVLLRCEAWSEAQIEALHRRGDCFVSVHRGEGWGYPLFEAASRGKPVIATAYGGPVDYLDPQRHWLVRNHPATVRQRYAYYHLSMNWAEPDIAHASEGMTWVHAHRDQARANATVVAQRIGEAFSIEKIGAAAKTRLMELLAQTDPAKLHRLRGSERQHLRPKHLPIPGDWYDADYFEHGIKSNWSRGYQWPLFKGVFENAAAYLAEMFPDARSFLDIGCAKGFLIQALRERGLHAYGFDHSAYAIGEAEAQAKPFIEFADVATVDYQRPFDVLVAMSILESLTEEQLSLFLPRARKWTQQALFAVIATLDDKAASAQDSDLSHVTMRERGWWCERFRAAGWRQDALHRLVERRCQAHPFPSRMGWSVYVFSPGE